VRGVWEEERKGEGESGRGKEGWRKRDLCIGRRTER
jgi:hypothetical protein